MSVFTHPSFRNGNTYEPKPIALVTRKDQSTCKLSFGKYNNLETIDLHYKNVKLIASGKDGVESQNVMQESLKVIDVIGTHQNDFKTFDKRSTLEKNGNLLFKKVKIGNDTFQELSFNSMQENRKLNDECETHQKDSKTSDKSSTSERKFYNLMFQKKNSTGSDKNKDQSTNSIKTNLNDECDSNEKYYKSCDKSKKTVTEVMNCRVSVLYSRLKEYEVIFNEFINYLRRQFTHLTVLDDKDRIAFLKNALKYESLCVSLKEKIICMELFMRSDHERECQKYENYFNDLMVKCDEWEDFYNKLMSGILQI